MLGLPLLWLKAGAVAALLIGLVWLVDEIGDRREALVNARAIKAQLAERSAADARERKSAEIAAQRQAEIEAERDQAKGALDALQLKLSPRKRVVVYPKDIVPELNR